MKSLALALTLHLVAVGCGKVQTDGPPGDGGVADVVTVSEVVRVRQGSQVLLDVGISRNELAGEVELAIDNLPTGVSAEPVAIDAGASSGALTVRAQGTAAQVGPLAIALRVTPVDGGDPLVVPLRLYVAGAPGSFDTSFSFDGIATTSSGDPVHENALRALGVDRDGKIVTVGGIQGVDVERRALLFRLNPDGSDDVSFGTAGQARPSLADSFGIVNRPDGGYLLAAIDGTDVVMAQLDDTGALVATTPSMVSSGGYTQVVRDDGVLISGGNVIERYTFDGALDPSFGTGGRASSATSGALSVDSQGRIITSNGLRIGRFLPDGSTDPGFSIAPVIPADRRLPTTRATAIDADDGGVACGKWVLDNLDPENPTNSVSDAFPVLVRFRANGTLDESFGAGGVLEILGAENGECQHVFFLPDGRMIIDGSRVPADNVFQAELWMLNPDGSFDTSFGTGGVLAAPNNSITVLELDEGLRVTLAGTKNRREVQYVARIWL